MQTISEIATYLRRFLGEATVGGAQVKPITIELAGPPYVQAEWFRFVLIFGENQFEIAASDCRKVIIHHPELDTGEDGIEPAYDETLEYNFLEIVEGDQGDSGSYSMVEFPMGIITSIDIYATEHQLRSQGGPVIEERFCGLRFNLNIGRKGDSQGDFGFMQIDLTPKVRMGLASSIFVDLPDRVRLVATVE